MEESLFLTRFATKVTLLHRRDALRASKIMQQRVFDNDKIEILWNTTVVDVLGENEVNGVRLRNVHSGQERDLPVGGFFVAIGHTPNTSLFKGWLEMDDQGYLVTEPRSTRTNINGIFASGDAQDHVTVKRSLLPAQAAWPRLMRSDSWQRRTRKSASRAAMCCLKY